ncbi:DUF4238 domain-containing protein [Methylobacterium haplocladii]|uniref:DUF4238 domain-containing protein n=1 Tax=Methylobacterium haplocladii TaxID=1176176 RepID=A0A512IJM2_9HYPH|nr:DUF4238 domain-containing protein [Methylobacterium haplocladii]GEO97838.1 hypothetical protein MHA02_02260 [Methylobacterium haplocladii]GJD82682.1 hypothetical protein HPGCJGGD_0541 [Methylobacterium haplocladii]GLS57530.1 hypothetical protein GCM10007887_01850 [Methylobacterium haplocladii]
MSTLTKNQHYVWCNYLREWTDKKGHIACYMLKERNSFCTKPENIAVERFFYELTDLNEIEQEWIDRLIERASNPEVRQMHRETVGLFQNIFKMQSWLDLQQDLADTARQSLQAKLDVMRKTLGERWHTGIENLAFPLLEKLKNSDVDFYNHEQDRINFIHYISQQFFRTPKLRVLQIRENHPYFDKGLDLDRTWFLESQIFATNVSAGIFLERNMYKFKFLTNETETSFITGDQPVISLGEDGIGFRLYYPLKPTLALIFEKDAIAPLKTETKAMSLQVNYYNSQMLKFSYNQIYGLNKEHLQAVADLPKDVLAG